MDLEFTSFFFNFDKYGRRVYYVHQQVEVKYN